MRRKEGTAGWARNGLVLFVVALPALILALSAHRYRKAQERVDSVRIELEDAWKKVQTIDSLRSKAPRVVAGGRPDRDVIARVNGTLAEAGLDQAVLRGLEPMPTAAVREEEGGASDRYRRQSVVVTLSNLQPAELGRFLAAWRLLHSVWVPTEIEMNVQQHGDTNRGGFDVRLVMTATYLSDASEKENG